MPLASYLSQDRADSLIMMPKRPANNQICDYPSGGSRVNIPLVSLDKTESFFLDISTSRVNFAKRKYQNRVETIVLVRLEINGTWHRNPDGTMVGPSHIHVYREGYGARWTFEVPNNEFMYVNNPRKTFLDFMDY
ncbi:MAG: hypothetical protein F4Z62_03645 [Rhodothermaceae bacterium]|nr:hypothetical protein [Rhodothermaceae bacterium]